MPQPKEPVLRLAAARIHQVHDEAAEIVVAAAADAAAEGVPEVPNPPSPVLPFSSAHGFRWIVTRRGHGRKGSGARTAR